MASLSTSLHLSLLGAVLLVGSHAHAQISPSVQIEEGREAYGSLDYEHAVQVLEAALEQPSIGPAERAQALETLAFALVVLDREPEARARLRELFALDPYYDVREPTRSPRIEAIVDRVRREVTSDAALIGGLDVRLELPRTARTDRAVRVRVRVGGEGHDRVSGVIVRHRGETDIDWSATTATPDPGDTYSAEIPALGRPERLELYAEARDARGMLLGRSTGPLSPAVLEVVLEPETGREPSVLESWWLWTIVGVVVLGTGIGIGAGVAADSGAAPSGTLAPGRVVLP